MMKYKTYIDESGNTGKNLFDANQKNFLLAFVSIPSNREIDITNKIQSEYNSVKEEGEKEIKTVRWVKSKTKRSVLKNILEYMISSNCDFGFVFVEKRFIVSSLIVSHFLDGAFNNIENTIWNGYEQIYRLQASNYFYKVLDDMDLSKIMSAFLEPTLEKMQIALEAVINKTTNEIYLTFLRNFKMKEFYDDYANDRNTKIEYFDIPNYITNSPNFISFSALGAKIVHFCKTNNYTTDMIFDSCLSYNDAYNKLYNLFRNIKSNDLILEKYFGIVSWKPYINSFNVDNSKNSFLLQTADILATSALKTLEKVFYDDSLNDYDKFILDKFLRNDKNSHYVMHNSLFVKLSCSCL